MTFISKHEERDSELPKERKKLLNNIQNDLFEDDNVLAFFYGGSLGNENTDFFQTLILEWLSNPKKSMIIFQIKKTVQRIGGEFCISKI